MANDFIAIDFETANEKRSSACAMGIAIVAGGHVERHTFLIRPPTRDFSPYNVAMHGIRFDDVKDAPSFADLYPGIQELLNSAPLWAHYAPFEKGVFTALSTHYGLALPKELSCTCKLSKQLFPELPNHKLPTVCQHLEISLAHHDPGSDAEACARIVLASQGRTPEPAMESPMDSLGRICRTIMEDGILTHEEAVRLHKWLHSQERDSIGYEGWLLEVCLAGVLMDGVLTARESEDVSRLITQIFGGPSPSISQNED